MINLYGKPYKVLDRLNAEHKSGIRLLNPLFKDLKIIAKKYRRHIIPVNTEIFEDKSLKVLKHIMASKLGELDYIKD